MIINSAPVNEAIMSNVNEIGEFRIRNSAKAFSILSSGLYANKIRAIIRELSCNAVDSHVAADNKETPFDIHLPNTLEPWFSVRDYGTGLSHDQVKNIYTTYFESTKTESNEFIGALGLGSKSPFSYTDNFTVTAVQSGRKGIYSAFINDQGVPSIALMMEEETTDPSGVEVKFSVNDRYDFDKFKQEARSVYTYFKLRPVISGCNDFKFTDVEYETLDIVPGVHSHKNGRRSVAIMGNIAYPIDVPEADKTLGDLRSLLSCGLEMHFAIGELDFQASREGLSYIPQTITSIKAKLDALNAQLAIHIAAEANAIDNLWKRALFLYNKKDNELWVAAVSKYIADTNFELLAAPQGGSHRHARMKVFINSVADLANNYNLIIRGFQRYTGNTAATTLKPDRAYGPVNASGSRDQFEEWRITVPTNVEMTFVVNDTKVGALERAKFHWKEVKSKANYTTVYVLEAADKAKPVKTDEFFAAISNPPAIVKASTLSEKPRVDGSTGKNVTIMSLEKRSDSYHSRRDEDMVWRDAGSADSFDESTVFYYLPLSGFQLESKFSYTSGKDLYSDMNGSGIAFKVGTIYGVRKGDIEFIKTQKNWRNLEDYVVERIGQITTKDLLGLALYDLASYGFVKYNESIANKIEDTSSPLLAMMLQFKGVDKASYNRADLEKLCRRFTPGASVSPDMLTKKLVTECEALYKRYPLFISLQRDCSSSAIAEYVNLIDAKKVKEI